MTVPGWEARLVLLLQTLEATRHCSIAAERRAQRRLRALLTDEQWRSYVVAGEFFERSRRSGVLYWFRRLRPTIALTLRRGGRGIRVALCSHLVGYHYETFAGYLPPSADVLAHLALMRADEHRFWKTAEPHPLGDLRAGV